MAVLLTGGTGKTSLRLARFLQDAKVPFLLASRKVETEAPSGMPATKFDWVDSSTFENPFKYKSPSGQSISAVYLVAPEIAEPSPPMIAFVDHAVEKHGVKRFVLLTGSSTEVGGVYVGKLWQHLVDLGVEYCVLRATWFMENFLEQQFIASIKNEGKIYTACGDGQIPFISALDIAAVAFHTLTDAKPHNTDYRILGPELLTYDKIAGKFSSALKRDIVHVKLSQEQKVQRLLDLGMPEHYAKFLAYLEAQSATEMEKRSNDTVQKVTGRPPMTFDTWVQQNKTAFDHSADPLIAGRAAQTRRARVQEGAIEKTAFGHELALVDGAAVGAGDGEGGGGVDGEGGEDEVEDCGGDGVREGMVGGFVVVVDGLA